MKTLITLLLTISSLPSMAQEIAGTVLDDKKEQLPGATVWIFRGSALKGSGVTGYDGDYSIKLTEPGYYWEVVFDSGFDSVTIHDIIVSPGQRTTQNFILTKSISQPKNIVKQYRKPLIDRDKTDIDMLTGGRVDDIISNPGGWIQAPRTTGAVYIIDGDTVNSSQVSICFCPPAKLAYDYPGTLTLTREELSELPVSDIRDIMTLMPGVYQQKRSDEVNIFGARADGNLYVADRMQLLR